MPTENGKNMRTRGVPRRVRRDDDIYCIYLYYLSFKEGEKVLTAHYLLYYDAIRDIEAKIREEIGKIAEYRKRHPTCYGTTFSDIRRRRKSFFVVVVEDDRNVVLAKDGLSFEDNIVEDYSGYDGKGKHTFTDFGYFDIPKSSDVPTTLQVRYCTNKLTRKKNPPGMLHVGEQENFKVRLHFVSRDQAIRLSDETGYYVDSGGTNLGPPVPPPAKI